MAKSVTLLKEALQSEVESITKYEEALKAMVHGESKKIVEDIIKRKNEHTVSLNKIIESSGKCPAIKK